MTPSRAKAATHNELLDARTNWTRAQWDAHFGALGVRAAGEASYQASGNDVLKLALLITQGRSCWYQGSANCSSRALLLREAEIDHMIPKKASANALAQAVQTSKYQRNVFDVHDPGNLAIICGPCNREKGRLNSKEYLPTPALAERRAKFEINRDKVISAFDTWHKKSGLDNAELQALEGVELSDESQREMYAGLIAQMIFNLAESLGQEFPISFGSEVAVEAGEYLFALGPSGAACEDYVAMVAEMQADDQRAESRFEAG